MVIRVTSYLENEIRHINESFRAAIAQFKYGGEFRGVFPIKVNQQAQVINRIVEFGMPFSHGLEAGSKPELVIALTHKLAKDALIVCNGVKDAKFIELAIKSRKLGFNTVIVLESPREADTVIEVAKRLGEDPMLGVRVKLTNQISGNWAESSGDRSTFGMNTDQLMATVDKLRDAGLLHCLVLQHSHLGSQVPDVNDVRRSVIEACRYFTELTREGVPLTHLDLGGGLGVGCVDVAVRYVAPVPAPAAALPPPPPPRASAASPSNSEMLSAYSAEFMAMRVSLFWFVFFFFFFFPPPPYAPKSIVLY